MPTPSRTSERPAAPGSLRSDPLTSPLLSTAAEPFTPAPPTPWKPQLPRTGRDGGKGVTTGPIPTVQPAPFQPPLPLPGQGHVAQTAQRRDATTPDVRTAAPLPGGSALPGVGRGCFEEEKADFWWRGLCLWGFFVLSGSRDCFPAPLPCHIAGRAGLRPGGGVAGL